MTFGSPEALYRLLSSCGAQASHYGAFSWCWVLTPGSAGFSGCGLRAQQLCFPDSGAEAQELWLTPASRSQHVGCSWTGDWTHVSCTGRWILIHWTTRETPIKIFLFHTLLSHGFLKGEQNKEFYFWTQKLSIAKILFWTQKLYGRQFLFNRILQLFPFFLT